MPTGSHFVAGGAIYPSRFVKIDTSADQTVLQCGANEMGFGISQTGTHDAPGLNGSTAYAANAELDPIKVFLLGERAPLQAGSGGFTAGSLLSSDADGKGVESGSNWAMAIAEETCAEGEIGYVRLVLVPL